MSSNGVPLVSPGFPHIYIVNIYPPSLSVGHKEDVYIDVHNPTGTQCSGYTACSGLLKEEDGTDIPTNTYMAGSQLVWA